MSILATKNVFGSIADIDIMTMTHDAAILPTIIIQKSLLLISANAPI